MKTHVYIDTSVIGSCIDQEFKEWSVATYYNVTVLSSWNFKHIVNLERIRKYNSVNLEMGYSILEIRSPRDILKVE